VRVDIEWTFPGVLHLQGEKSPRQFHDVELFQAASADPTRMPRGSRAPHAEPYEIAPLVAYLASDEARFMVGSAASTDGGLTA
jgi:NAD(P)-dependent dehydrogenase (short-subunit alcohol dehydrogenase family)